MTRTPPHLAGPGRAARCSICTVSDTRTPETDGAGTLLQEGLLRHGHHIVAYDIVPDEPEAIRAFLNQALIDETDVVIYSGGTGIAARDRTPDVLRPLFHRDLPGFGELFRWLSFQEIGPRAFFSRAVAGIVDHTAVFSVPGSPAAAALALERLLLPDLPHLLGELSR